MFTHTLVTYEHMYKEGDISVSLETTTTYQQKGTIFVCFLFPFQYYFFLAFMLHHKVFPFR